MSPTDLLEAEALRVLQSLLHAPLQGGLVLHRRQTLLSHPLIRSYIANVSAITIYLMSVAIRQDLNLDSSCRVVDWSLTRTITSMSSKIYSLVLRRRKINCARQT